MPCKKGSLLLQALYAVVGRHLEEVDRVLPFELDVDFEKTIDSSVFYIL